jgi:hypothetical protein
MDTSLSAIHKLMYYSWYEGELSYQWKEWKNDQVEEDELGRACSTDGEIRNTYRLFVGKPEGRRPLGIHLHYHIHSS